jgi:hypothetical protein
MTLLPIPKLTHPSELAETVKQVSEEETKVASMQISFASVQKELCRTVVAELEESPQKEEFGLAEQNEEKREHSVIPGMSLHNLDRVSKRGQSESPV